MVTPLGCGHHHVWNELISGKCGIVKLDAPEYADIPSKVAALVPRGVYCVTLCDEKEISEILTPINTCIVQYQ